MTDNDQAQFWLACHDFSNLRFYTPFIYGCSYGSMLESFLAIPFYTMGLPLYYALPFSNFFWFSSLILCFAWGLNKRFEKGWFGIVFLCFLTWVDDSFFAVTYAAKGHLAGIIPALLVGNGLLRCTSKQMLLIYGFLFGLSLQFNPNALFLIVVLLLLMELPKNLCFLLVGSLLSVAYIPLSRYFLPLTDTGFLHPQWAIEFHFSDFLKTLQHIDRYFDAVTPVFSTMGFISLGFPLLLGFIFLYKKQPMKAFVSGILVLLIVFSFGVNKIFDGSSDLLFPYFRFYLALAVCNAFCMAYILEQVNFKSEKYKLLFLISLPLFMLYPGVRAFSNSTKLAGEVGYTYAVKKSRIRDLKTTCDSLLKTIKTHQSKNTLIVTGDYLLYAEMIYIKTLEPKGIEILFHHHRFYWMDKLNKDKTDLIVFILFEGLLQSEKIKALAPHQIRSKTPAFLFRNVENPDSLSKAILK